MINWVPTSSKTSYRIKGDVSVSIVDKGRRVTVRFSPGAMSVKLGHAERVMIGFDETCTRCYFKKGMGYKLTINKDGSGLMLLLSSKIEKLMGRNCAVLSGDYFLNYDKESEAYYFSIGALPR